MVLNEEDCRFAIVDSKQVIQEVSTELSDGDVSSNSTASIPPSDPKSSSALVLPSKNYFSATGKLIHSSKLQSFTAPTWHSRRSTTMITTSTCRSTSDERYQLARQDASVSHARRSPLGS
ncbi:unnamed protein product [Anisakis simplex]|uniref:Uncharacterized protein n=1 Tax=Anisakis simplex TaxID=6269 RepID=A0A0M3K353_ANISI|nr:unnamed protein product [Anisakis simplex]